ncbi:unnamed protein product [Fraxinus pennsylvanica]|uniref:Pentatricopeptide repeat-containing protein n=1 Tax=Fraxinus pennsylvanica TaxID=56036 RepID=A0AAD1ZQW8_9LAMI|nr:unnamed protein product [Fraxinus pennsylvanica]
MPKRAMERQFLRLSCRMAESEPRLSNYTFSTILNDLAISGDLRAGQMLNGHEDEFTLANLISDAPDLGDLSYCQSIHACSYKFGYESEDLVSNALIAMYIKFQAIYEGCRVFNAMTRWDVVSWNALLSGFHDDEISNQGPKLFKHMLAEENFEYDGNMGTTLIDTYAKYGALEYEEVFLADRMRKTSLLGQLSFQVIHRLIKERELLAASIRCEGKGVEPNEFTLANCLRACSEITSLENGRQLHSLVIKGGQSFDFL